MTPADRKALADAASRREEKQRELAKAYVRLKESVSAREAARQLGTHRSTAEALLRKYGGRR